MQIAEAIRERLQRGGMTTDALMESLQQPRPVIESALAAMPDAARDHPYARWEIARPHAMQRATAFGASRWLQYFSERINAGADLADVLDEVIAWGLKTRARVKG
jgi:hypothetical protein